MKTIEIKVYKFEELDKQTKEKVIENYRYINVEDKDWWEFIQYNLKNLYNIELHEFNLDRGYSVNINIKSELFEVCENIIREKTYFHFILSEAKSYVEKYNEIQSNNKEDEVIEQLVEQLDYESNIEKHIENSILKSLDCEWEYCISDEAVTDTIEVNDFDFTTDGKIY
jgi:hypothetical protein